MTDENNIAININKPFEYLKEIHTKVVQYKCLNYKGARVPVPSGLVIPALHSILCDYDIPLLAQYLQFGFPLGVDYDVFKFQKFTKNYLSACQSRMGLLKYKS